jgi:hypothetical protein
MKDPILLLSSTLFVIPMTYAASCQFWYIYGAHLALLMASIAYHSSKNQLVMRLDQLTICNMIYLSFITGYELQLVYLPALGTLWCIYVYLYGYATNTLGFSPHYIESSLYHGSIHAMVSGTWTYGIYVKQNLNSQ